MARYRGLDFIIIGLEMKNGSISSTTLDISSQCNATHYDSTTSTSEPFNVQDHVDDTRDQIHADHFNYVYTLVSLAEPIKRWWAQVATIPIPKSRKVAIRYARGNEKRKQHNTKTLVPEGFPFRGFRLFRPPPKQGPLSSGT
jgi:hypothetical protein